MKKLFAAIAAIALALTLALPAGALRLIPPEFYNERYTYYYADFNRDGVMELVTYGGEPGGYTGFVYPEYKIYISAGNEVNVFTCAEGSEKTGGPLSGSPRGCRNWLTRQRKILCVGGVSGWGGYYVDEMNLDYESFTYSLKQIRNFYMAPGMGLFSYFNWLRYGIWNIFWNVEGEMGDCSVEGALTPERIEELLLNPPV